MSSVTHTSSVILDQISNATTLRGPAQDFHDRWQDALDVEKAINRISDITNITSTALGLVPNAGRVIVAATKVLGVAGACFSFVCDGIESAKRIKAWADLKKIDVPNDPHYKWAHSYVQAQRDYTKILLTCSAVVMAVDTVEVAASVVPVISTPANFVSLGVALSRIYIEARAGTKLRDNLEKNAKDYKKHHHEIIAHKEAHKDRHEKLKNRYDQAVAANEDITVAQKAELQESAILIANLKAYEEALKLILALDPELKLEQQLKGLLAAYEQAHPQVLEKNGAVELEIRCESELQRLKNDLELDLSLHGLLPSTPYRKQLKKDIQNLKTQLKDIKAYRKAREDLTNLYKKRQENFENQPLQKEHFETQTPSPRQHPSTPIRVHTPPPPLLSRAHTYPMDKSRPKLSIYIPPPSPLPKTAPSPVSEPTPMPRVNPYALYW